MARIEELPPRWRRFEGPSVRAGPWPMAGWRGQRRQWPPPTPALYPSASWGGIVARVRRARPALPRRFQCEQVARHNGRPPAPSCAPQLVDRPRLLVVGAHDAPVAVGLAAHHPHVDVLPAEHRDHLVGCGLEFGGPRLLAEGRAW